jgi:hypothetical protein
MGAHRPREPDRVRNVCTATRRLLARPRLAQLRGRSFADRSGGLITFEIDSVEAAQQLVTNDPFYREDLPASHWLKSGWSSDELWRRLCAPQGTAAAAKWPAGLVPRGRGLKNGLTRLSSAEVAPSGEKAEPQVTDHDGPS